jgi:hypothetical protein
MFVGNIDKQFNYIRKNNFYIFNQIDQLVQLAFLITTVFLLNNWQMSPMANEQKLKLSNRMCVHVLLHTNTYTSLISLEKKPNYSFSSFFFNHLTLILY